MQVEIYTHNIKLIDYYKKSKDEYVKRLSRFCDIKIIPFKKLKLQEKDIILQFTPEGEKLDSVELSNLIKKTTIYNGSKIKVILDNQCYIKENENPNLFIKNIELTSISLNEDISITLLLEQLYRSFKIMNNETYHK